MTEHLHVPAVGIPQADLRTSPILEEGDEDYGEAEMNLEPEPVCYFNGVTFQQGDYVCSGNDLLHCDRGVWVRQGNCDADHP